MNDRAQPRPSRGAILFVALAASCAGAPSKGSDERTTPPPPPTPTSTAAPSAAKGRSSAPATPDPPDPSKPLVRPAGPLTRRDAQLYALALLNRDRAEKGLAPVALDETASKAGDRHARDMAHHGYTAHIGTDGSNPEMRLTEAGGAAMVMENVACFGDAVERELDPDPTFSVDELERIERTFIEEKPPADGHKRNILTPQHTAVGIGLAKAKGFDIVCLAQEFLDIYGDHEPLPTKAKVGDVIKVSGEARAPAVIYAVGVARVEKPKPGKAAALMLKNVYPIPKPYVTYFPKGFKTPIPLIKNGSAYSIEVPLYDGGKRGLYEISVWATLPQAKEPVMISLRTILVD